MDQLIDEDSSSSTGSPGVEFEKSEKTEQKRADGNLIESEPDEETYICDACSRTLTSAHNRYHCTKCEDFDLCEKCYIKSFDSEKTRHRHLMNKIKGTGLEEHLLFEYRHPGLSHSVYLANWVAALPNSRTMRQKRIRSVLSLIDFGERTTQLAKVYGSSPIVVHNGVVYYKIDLPDLQNPALLAKYDLAEILEKTTSWLDLALSYGDALVHCEMGQRRSPTILLAWMITRGIPLDKGIQMISQNYRNTVDYDPKSNTSSWAANYQQTRPLWLKKLAEWSTQHESLRASWRQKHRALVKSWKLLFKAGIPSSSSSSSSGDSRNRITVASPSPSSPVGKRKREQD